MGVLQQGSSGPDVTALQTKLKALGFDPNGVDGNFGPGTKAAVIAFQQSIRTNCRRQGRTEYDGRNASGRQHGSCRRPRSGR